MKTLENHEKIEKVVNILCIISAVAFATGITATVLWLIFGKSFLSIIACYGFTFFMLPFLALQIAMPANIGQYGTKAVGRFSWVFFLVVFPFVDMWFFTGINALYHIIPNFHLITDKVLREEAAINSTRQAWFWIAIIYFSLITIGLIIRMIRDKRKKVVLT